VGVLEVRGTTAAGSAGSATLAHADAANLQTVDPAPRKKGRDPLTVEMLLEHSLVRTRMVTVVSAKTDAPWSKNT
jgi:hypothetical protein